MNTIATSTLLSPAPLSLIFIFLSNYLSLLIKLGDASCFLHYSSKTNLNRFHCPLFFSSVFWFSFSGTASVIYSLNIAPFTPIPLSKASHPLRTTSCLNHSALIQRPFTTEEENRVRDFSRLEHVSLSDSMSC